MALLGATYIHHSSTNTSGSSGNNKYTITKHLLLPELPLVLVAHLPSGRKVIPCLNIRPKAILYFGQVFGRKRYACSCIKSHNAL